MELSRYPGCVKIRRKATGVIHWLGKIKDDFTLEIGDTIYRDTVDGDIVGFNRQPSLEPSSISSMKVRVMEKGDTIRTSVLACPLFNSDFDGDAMNVLFPRSSRTRNEINRLSSPAQFFISYKDGKPKLGEAQDSVVGLAELTLNETRMDKYHAMQLFNQTNIYFDFSKYSANHQFSGREIITIYLRESGNHINLSAVPSFYNPDHVAFRVYDPQDIKVEIDRGVLKSGVLDKATIGEESNGSIFHVIHNQYGPHAALDASFYLQQIAIAFLFTKGFTINLRDLLLRQDVLNEIHQMEAGLIAESLRITDDLNQGRIIAPLGKTLDEHYEELQINALKADDTFWHKVLGSVDPDNNCLFKAIIYGARGKLSNFMQTACAVGQLEINGSRFKETFGGRALPYFSKCDSDPAGRGYIANSYISGITSTEFFFHSMESRYALINRALSTSITGTHNRMSIKNLEPIMTDNQRKATNGSRIIQLLYGADGADPRFIEKVKFPTMRRDLTWETFEKEFKATPDMFPVAMAAAKKRGKLTARTDQLQTLFDEEYNRLVEDRRYYTNLFTRIEMINSRPYNDFAFMPVNPYRIIEDTLYNLELKNASKIDLDPFEALERVKKLCDNIPYCLLNNNMRRAGKPIPEYLQKSCTLLCVLIRSHLNLRNLLKRHVNNTALRIIIKQIKVFYSRALIDYGKAIGIIAAQSISEPMTQMVLNSHHFSGSSSTKKQGMFRIKEILSARPTADMKSPSMTLHVLPEYQNNKFKVREIANHIEMLPLKQFVNGWQIFFEKYGEPIHPAFKEEKHFIREFEKYHLHTKPPADLTRWCIRLALDKSKLIEKQMKIETIYHQIRKQYPATYVVYSTDNAENTIMRIYLRSTYGRQGELKTQDVIDLVKELSGLIVRGINGIIAAHVKEGKVNKVSEDGSITMTPVYYIFTEGTNLSKILENPYIDPDTAQSDSILETYEMFGITAARNKIINELRHQVDGSSYRHYTIYADEMTHGGVVTSIDRYGSAKRNSSILLRISDADPIKVIEESAINAFKDDLAGVSPPIMIGKNPEIGDLYNTFKLDEDMIAENVKKLDDIIADL